MSSGWNYVALADVPPVPWRNGGGVTRELLAWPSPQDWQVRISVAEVAQDGPFSRFEGIERWFAVLQGEGVRLSLNGLVHELRMGSPPLRFHGGAAVEAALVGGPTLDFNLMAPPGKATLQLSSPRRRGSSASWIPASAGMTGRLVAVYDITSATLAWQVTQAAVPVPPDANALIAEVLL